jgi:hypothetical protein
VSSEIDGDSVNLNTPSRHTSTGSRPDPSSRATSSGEIEAGAVSYEYGGFAPNDEGLVETQEDVKPKVASRYKVRSNSFLTSARLTFHSVP